jgi:hypothetical protein
MQKALGKTSEAVAVATELNKKVVDMKLEFREHGFSDPLTSDFGVKGISHDL